MKILLTHRYFWPDSPNCGQILWNLVKHYSSKGYMVDVITSLPSYNHNSKKIFSKKKEKLNNLKIRRIELLVEGNSPFKKLINAIRLGLWTNYLAIKGNYDIIISTSIPPISGGFFAALASYITKARFIYFCMDLHPEIGKISKDFSNPLLFMLLKKIDNWSCSRARPVVVHSLDMKNTILSRGIKKKPEIKIINNFSIPTESLNKPFSSKDLQLNNAKLKIIFAGNLGRFQALDKIIDAMALLRNKKDIKLILVGDGSIKKKLMLKIKKSMANVHLLNRQPIDITKEIIKKADIGLVSLDSNIYKYGYPSKLMTYLEQGKPIAAVLEKESEIAKLIENENCGFCIPTLESEKIAQYFVKLTKNDSWKLKMSNNATNVYKKYFTRSKIYDEWSKIL